MPEGGPMDTLSTLLLADAAVRIAMLSLVGLGRQARRRS